MCGIIDQHLREVNGDSLINGHVYKKVFNTLFRLEKECSVPPGTCDDTLFFHHNGIPSFFLRDTIGSMYRLMDGVEELLYDMDLEVGDTIPYTVMWRMSNKVVLSVDSVVVHGMFRKRYQTGTHQLVEGVGWAENGSFRGLLLPTYIGYCGYGGFCYSVGDTAYFPTTGAACEMPTAIPSHVDGTADPAIFPNPASGEAFIDLPSDVVYVRLLNAIGAEVWRKHQPAPGRLHIPLGGMTAGTYVVEVRTRTGDHSQRLFVTGH